MLWAEQDIKLKAEKLQQAVESLTETDVIETVREGKPLTIAAMLADQNRSQSDSPPGAETTPQSLREVTALRQLEELRLTMTQQAAVRMLKQDINIDTRDLSQVVAKLRNVEAQMTRPGNPWNLSRKRISPTDCFPALLEQETAHWSRNRPFTPPCIQLGARWLNRRNAKARTRQGCCRIPLVRVSFGCSPLAHRASDMLSQIPICRCSTLQPQTYSEDCGVRLPLEETQSRGGGPMCPPGGDIVRFSHMFGEVAMPPTGGHTGPPLR